MKLYWRVKRNGKWTWQAVVVQSRTRLNNKDVQYTLEEWKE